MPPRAIYEASGPIELVLEGENLTPDTLKLYHNGVLYTPLESSDTYAYYLLGDNGTNKVVLNGKNFCTVNVKNIVVPELSQRKRMVQLPPNTWALGQGINQEDAMANCINYPHVASDSYPRFKLAIFNLTEQPLESDFACVNGELGGYNYTEGASSVAIGAEVTDRTKPAYITYQGFIVAVFNYTA